MLRGGAEGGTGPQDGWGQTGGLCHRVPAHRSPARLTCPAQPVPSGASWVRGHQRPTAEAGAATRSPGPGRAHKGRAAV